MEKLLIGLVALGSVFAYADQTPIRLELGNGLTLVTLTEAVPNSLRTQVTSPYLYVEGRVDTKDENLGLRDSQANKICSLLGLGKAIYVATGVVNSPSKISKALKSEYFEQFNDLGILYLTCSLDNDDKVDSEPSLARMNNQRYRESNRDYRSAEAGQRKLERQGTRAMNQENRRRAKCARQGYACHW